MRLLIFQFWIEVWFKTDAKCRLFLPADRPYSWIELFYSQITWKLIEIHTHINYHNEFLANRRTFEEDVVIRGSHTLPFQREYKEGLIRGLIRCLPMKNISMATSNFYPQVLDTTIRDSPNNFNTSYVWRPFTIQNNASPPILTTLNILEWPFLLNIFHHENNNVPKLWFVNEFEYKSEQFTINFKVNKPVKMISVTRSEMNWSKLMNHSSILVKQADFYGRFIFYNNKTIM